VLLVAGARVELSLLVIVLGLLYASLRTVGTLAASATAARLAGLRRSRAVVGHLARPGVFGVAFALNVADSAGGSVASLLLAMVVIGTIASEFAALMLRPGPGER
jgi:hypothetical protein